VEVGKTPRLGSSTCLGVGGRLIMAGYLEILEKSFSLSSHIWSDAALQRNFCHQRSI